MMRRMQFIVPVAVFSYMLFLAALAFGSTVRP
jgi:hypothetical protein